jgi:hypothetical protein
VSWLTRSSSAIEMRKRSQSQPKYGDVPETDWQKGARVVDDREAGSYTLSNPRGEPVSKLKLPSGPRPAPNLRSTPRKIVVDQRPKAHDAASHSWLAA